MYKKIISLILAVGIILGLSACAASGLSSQSDLEAFASNHIIVVLTNAASLKCKEYTPADFPEIQCKTVQELTIHTKRIVKAKLADDPSLLEGKSIEEAQALMDSIDLTTYSQILLLELKDFGKEHVQEAIQILQNREDVSIAELDYTMTLDNS